MAASGRNMKNVHRTSSLPTILPNRHPEDISPSRHETYQDDEIVAAQDQHVAVAITPLIARPRRQPSPLRQSATPDHVISAIACAASNWAGAT